MRDRADLESIHRFSVNHRELLARSERAGCFYCCSTYPPGEIEEWIDETADTPDGVTALCPRCGIDAVLPSAAPIQLDEDLLIEMRRYWF